jgi:hypothetical protein
MLLAVEVKGREAVLAVDDQVLAARSRGSART